MKLEKIFKKAQEFFGMEDEERKKSTKKAEKLILLLEEKISSMKEKIKDSNSEAKREALVKEIDVLKELKKDCENLFENK